MFIVSDLKVGNYLYDKTEDTCYIIALTKPGSGYIFLVSSKREGKEISLPERYSTSAICRKLEDGKLELLVFNPFQQKIPDYSNLSDAQRKHVDKLWPKVSRLVQHSDLYSSDRYKLIEDIGLDEKNGAVKISPPTLLKALRNYFFGGMCKVALAANFHNCGAKGRAKSTRKVSQAVVDLITEGFRKYYLNSDLSIDEARRRMIRLDWNEEIHGSFILNNDTFRRYGKMAFPNAYENKMMRLGVKNAKRNHRLHRGRSTDIGIGPGSLFQIDWTQLDINVVASFNRSLYIGKPKLYCVVDTYSRLLVGILITMEDPCWRTFMHAIYYAAMDKVKLAAYYGYKLPNIWLGNCLPQQFIADGEAANLKANSLGENHGITLAIAESYRGDLKGIVENMQKEIKARVRAAFIGSGLTAEPYGRRLGVDARKEACVTLQELYHIAFDIAIEYNSLFQPRYPNHKDLLANLVDKDPNSIWMWAEEHGFGIRRSENNEEKLILDLLNRESIAPSDEGFRIEKHQFIPIAAEDQRLLENLINKPSGAGEMPVIFDPSCFNQTKYWYYEGRLIPLRKLGSDEQEYSNIWEMQAVNDHYNQRGKNVFENEDKTKMRTDENIEKIIENAKAQQRKTGEKVRVNNTAEALKTQIDLEKARFVSMLPKVEVNESGILSDNDGESDSENTNHYFKALESFDQRRSKA